MPVLQLEVQVSTTDLLNAIGQLNSPELDSFVAQVIALQARRHATSLPQRESELLLAIREGLSDDKRQRYDELLAGRFDESLTPAEYEELLRLTDRVEEYDAQRLTWLAELATLRGQSLTTLMADLGLKASE